MPDKASSVGSFLFIIVFKIKNKAADGNRTRDRISKNLDFKGFSGLLKMKSNQNSNQNKYLVKYKGGHTAREIAMRSFVTRKVGRQKCGLFFIAKKHNVK